MGEPQLRIDEDLLKRFVPLNALVSGSLRQIADKAVIDHFKAGQKLFRKGDRDGNNLYLLSGRIELVAGRQRVAVEAESETSRHPIGQHQPRQVDAVAKTPVMCLRVPTAQVDMLLTWQQTSDVEVGDIESDQSDDWMTRMLQNRLFLKLPPANIQRILMLMEDMEVKKGEVIIRQGDEGDYYYYVRSGSCEIVRQPRAGAAEVKLAEVPAGESFGEEALLADERRNATVRMLTDGELMRLAKKDFVKLIGEPLHNMVDYYQAEVLVHDGAAWLDVRLRDEHANSHISDAINLPLPTLRLRLNKLDKDRKYVVYCDTGRRSATAAFLLSELGIDACVLAGGLMSLPSEVFLASHDTEDSETFDSAPNIVSAQKMKAKRAEAAAKAAPPVEAAPERRPAPGASSTTASAASRSADFSGEGRQGQPPARGEANKSGPRPVPVEPAAGQQQIAELNQLKAALEQRSRELEEAEAGKMLLERELERAEEQSARIGRELAEVQRDNADLDRRLQEQKSAGASAIEKRTTEWERERSALEAKLAGVEKELAQGRTRLDDSLRERERLEQRIGSLESSNEAAATERAVKWESERSALQAKLVGVEKELAQARGHLDDSLRENERLTNEVRELDASREEAAAESAARWKNERQRLEEEIGELQSRHERETLDLDAKVQEAVRGRSEAQNERDVLAVEAERLRAESGAAQGLAKELVQVRRELDEARAAQELADQQRQATEAQQQEMTAAIEHDRNELQRVRDELNFTQRTLTQTLAEKEQGELSLRKAQDRLDREQAEREQRDAEVSEELDRLRAELDEQRDHLIAARSARDSAETARLAAEQALRRATEQSPHDDGEGTEQDDRLSAELEAVRGELEAQRHALGAAVAERDAAREDYDKAERGRREAQEEAADLRAEREQRVGEIAAELDDGRNELEELQRTLAETIAERDTARDARDEAERAQRQAEDETERAREDRKIRDRELKAELDRLQQEIAQYQERLDEALAVKGEAEAARLNAEEKSAQLMAEYDERHRDLESQIQEQQTVLARMEEELSQVGRITEEADSARKRSEGHVVRMASELEQVRQALKATENEKDQAWQARKHAEQEVARARRDAVEAMQKANGEVERAQEDLRRVRAEAEEEILRRLEVETSRFRSQESTKAPEVYHDAAHRNERAVTIGATAPRRDPRTTSGRHRPAKKKRRAGLLFLLSALTVAAVTAYVFKDQILILLGSVPAVSTITQAVTSGADTAAPAPAPKPQPSVPKAAPVKAHKASAERHPTASRNSTRRSGSLQDALRSGGFGPVMVRLPGGEFLMGADDGSTDATARPRHKVRVRPFAMGKYEVTFAEYDRFAKATGRELPDDLGRGRSRQPVVNVSWADAQAYAAWLTQQTGHHYRLPSEAEWEYAARAGHKGSYWWGSAIGDGNATCFNCGTQWDGKQPAPVGSFRPNPFGLYDTAGNVSEWTEDCYHASYKGAPDDGSAWVDGDCTERVVRGGSFASPARGLYNSNRERYPLDTRLDNLGFRLVREN